MYTKNNESKIRININLSTMYRPMYQPVRKKLDNPQIRRSSGMEQLDNRDGSCCSGLRRNSNPSSFRNPLITINELLMNTLRRYQIFRYRDKQHHRYTLIAKNHGNKLTYTYFSRII